jgi:hypothetical protein
MKVIAVLFIVLALVIGIVPQFTDCASQGKVIELPNGKTIAMQCHWSARAELALALPLLVTGVLMLANRRKQTLRSLSIVTLTLGIVAMLVPTYLIGTCTNPDMICAMLMRPTVLLAGALTVIVSIVALVYLRGPEPEQVAAA